MSDPPSYWHRQVPEYHLKLFGRGSPLILSFVQKEKVFSYRTTLLISGKGQDKMCAKESYEVFLVGEVVQPAKPHNFLRHNLEDGGEETVEGDAAGGDGDWQVGCQGYLYGREENNKSPEKLRRYAPTKGNHGKKEMKEKKDKKEKKK